jgi:hypothetical protein
VRNEHTGRRELILRPGSYNTKITSAVCSPIFRLRAIIVVIASGLAHKIFRQTAAGRPGQALRNAIKHRHKYALRDA